MTNEIMLELAEELVDPTEAVLDDQLEDALDNETDALLGVGDDDDEVIAFIDKGGRLGSSDPIDFTDDDVEETLEDEDDEEAEDVEDLIEKELDLDQIEEANTFII